jgi:hypothetical protein
VDHFQEFAVQGVDLLAAEEELLRELGIQSTIHLNRIKASIRQLVIYQEKVDKATTEENSMQKEEKIYFDFETQYQEILSKTRNYEQPVKMEFWSPFDLFHFLKSTEKQELFTAFIKPCALLKIGGKDIMHLCSQTTETVSTLYPFG